MSGAFEASEPFAFFDYARVPYQVTPPPQGGPAAALGAGQLWPVPGDGPRLLWARAGRRSGRDVHTGRFTVDGIPLAGSVLRDDAVRRRIGTDGASWSPTTPVLDAGGERVASVWSDGRDGSVLLPFDPGEVMEVLWSERYRRLGRTAAARALLARTAVRTYYGLRPVLPRAVQLRLRRSFSKVQGRAEFPRWPVEDALGDLYAWLFTLLGDLSGRPVPWLHQWPDGHDWALVLTHDVEQADGLRVRELLRGPERELGFVSSWNLVAERYEVDDDVVRALHDDGCEVGVHGLRHDGRDLGSRRLLRRRLPAMRRAAERWGAVGFRSPATQRRWEWMPEMGFEYDSSWSDTDPYEPQPGGCCTTLPFHNGGLVELPITLPQDHTVFAVLDRPDGTLWLDKATHVRRRGGMALVLTHPDYAPDPRVTGAYRALLEAFHDDPTAWHALPREVAAWWRQRAESWLHRGPDGSWEVSGPAAARGRVAYGAGWDRSVTGSGAGAGSATQR